MKTKQRPVFKPGIVLRFINQQKMPGNIKGGRIACEKCRRLHPKADTESPAFWEGGMYIHCPHCKAQTLARPVFPPCKAYPQGFEISLTGERKVYDLILAS